MIYNNRFLIALVLAFLTTLPAHSMEITEHDRNAKKRTAPIQEQTTEDLCTLETSPDTIVDALCNLVTALELSTKKPPTPTTDTHAANTPHGMPDTVVVSLCSLIEKVTLSQQHQEELAPETRTALIRATATNTDVVDALHSVFAALTIKADSPEQTDTETTTPQAATADIPAQDNNAQLAAQLRQRLLQHKDRTRARARQEEHMAHTAIVESLCDLVEKIELADHRHELVTMARLNNRALFEAAEDGSLQTLCSLLTKGVNPNFVYHGTTPLIVAAGNGHLFSVQALLASGASVNRTNDKGQTALSWAASRGYADVVNMLLAHGAHDIPDYAGKTALSCAIAHDHNTIAHTLSLYWGNVMQQAILNTWCTQQIAESR